MKRLITFAALAATCMLGSALAQEHTREYVIDDRGRQRAFSRAVATTGGKIVWLAGQTTTTDANGNSLAGDFEGQTREIFRILDELAPTYDKFGFIRQRMGGRFSASGLSGGPKNMIDGYHQRSNASWQA